MKSHLLAAALAGAILTSSALAYSPKDKRPLTPPPRVVPSSVVKPTGLPYKFAGSVINIEFSLDAAGQPQNIKVLWVDDPVLKRQLVAAFRQWRFEVSNSAEGDQRFILPVELQPEA
jgi:outer membrane biosynthesis protein TonB